LLCYRFENLLDGIIPSGVFADLPSAQSWVQQMIAGAGH